MASRLERLAKEWARTTTSPLLRDMVNRGQHCGDVYAAHLAGLRAGVELAIKTIDDMPIHYTRRGLEVYCIRALLEEPHEG